MQHPSSVRKRFSPQERHQLLEAYRHSRLTQRAFAARVGLSVSCLQTWLRQRRRTPATLAPVRLLEVTTALAPSVSPSRPYRVQFPSGVSLEIASGFLPGELSPLCQIVKSL